jgi:hypothetical protein
MAEPRLRPLRHRRGHGAIHRRNSAGHVGQREDRMTDFGCPPPRLPCPDRNNPGTLADEYSRAMGEYDDPPLTPGDDLEEPEDDDA